LEAAPQVVIPAKAGIQNKNGPLSFLEQPLPLSKQAAAFNYAALGFRQNSGIAFDGGIGPE
jgi:hypothetical protein